LGVGGLSIGRSGGSPRPAFSRFAPFDGDAAARQAAAATELLVLVDLWRRGMQEPLPLACATSAAWAAARRHEHSVDDAALDARKVWESRGMQPGEQDDREHVRVWGRHARFEQLTADPPRRDEQGPGWPAGEGSRFGCLARRLWDGLLAHEQQGLAT
jgi:exodeoxyribonuclease V gamma subunit